MEIISNIRWIIFHNCRFMKMYCPPGEVATRHSCHSYHRSLMRTLTSSDTSTGTRVTRHIRQYIHHCQNLVMCQMSGDRRHGASQGWVTSEMIRITVTTLVLRLSKHCLDRVKIQVPVDICWKSWRMPLVVETTSEYRVSQKKNCDPWDVWRK